MLPYLPGAVQPLLSSLGRVHIHLRCLLIDDIFHSTAFLHRHKSYKPIATLVQVITAWNIHTTSTESNCPNSLCVLNVRMKLQSNKYFTTKETATLYSRLRRVYFPEHLNFGHFMSPVNRFLSSLFSYHLLFQSYYAPHSLSLFCIPLSWVTFEPRIGRNLVKN